MPNKLSQFWQELKRRKVVRVITVYAAAAFVIMEVANNISDSLDLPVWISKWVVLLLGIGLIITILLSWIFDITPTGIQKTKPINEIDKEDAIASSNSWKIATYISLGLIILLIGFNILSLRNISRDIVVSDKTIAVLPFHNLSSDTTQAYFCDQIMEEILNQLDKVGAFSLRSRTSTDQYKNTEKISSVIGDELNVNFLIEGSVGLEGNKIKIWIKLINAKTDERIWSDDYVREKENIFNIQSDIAKKIAEKLKVVLSSEEIDKIEKMPTENNEAYIAYMRGKYYINLPHFDPKIWEQALQNFKLAIETDTGFAMAYGELARTHARFYNLRYDLSESRLEKADNSSAMAIKFGPEKPEVHLSLAYYYLWAYHDQDRALEHLEFAERYRPNNVQVLVAKAELLIPLGKWDEYNKVLKKASELSPQDATIFTDLAMGLWVTRQYEDALDACNHAIMLNPDLPWAHIYKFSTLLNWIGPSRESRDALKFLDAEHPFYKRFLYYQEIGEGNFQAALELISDTSDIWISKNKVWVTPKANLSASLYNYLNDKELAQKNYRLGLNILLKEVNEDPGNPSVHSSLGIAYAGVGQKQEAIREGLLAVDLLPIEKDAFYGIAYVLNLAIIYTMIDEFELALDQLEYLLSVPSYLSVRWLEWDIAFAPLKTLTRYKKMLIKYEIEK